MDKSAKDHLRTAYKVFLNSPAGVDFMKQAEILEKSFILQAIKGKTANDKANSVSRLEGMITLRDYMLRMSKKD